MTLEDMVREGSMSDDGRELLRGIAAAARSFLAYALPQNAGKSTLVHAMLAEVPSDLPQRTFFGTTEETSALAAIDPRGYLVVNEIGHRGRPGYLAQDEVRRLFQLVEQGYLVASSLHADSVEEVVRVLRDNGASEHACSEVSFLIKIRALGPPHDSRTRRVIEAIHEIEARPSEGSSNILLYRWDPQRDEFETMAKSRLLA